MAKQIVKNASSGYGYNYASLADVANQGYEIPQMRIKPTEFGDYVEYKDPKDGEWHIGSKVVIPEMKGKTSAQMYGAGLTYARRYATYNCLGLVCSDDVDVENYAQSTGSSRGTSHSSDKLTSISKCMTIHELANLWNSLTCDEQKAYESRFSQRKYELGIDS